MSNSHTLEEARGLFQDRFIGPDDVAAALGCAIDNVDAALPFRRDQLADASHAGEVLIFRTATANGEPLTIRSLIQRFPDTFDAKLLQASGYQLKNEWGIELEPLAASDTCRSGWSLLQPEVLPGSCNQSYPEQTAALAAYAARIGVEADSLRRRTAVEAVYDTVLYFAVRRRRLLEKTWDWTSSRTVDGGLLNVGGFGTGLQVLGFSPGIRHGGLGVCPTRQP